MAPSAEEILAVANALADNDQQARRDQTIRRIRAGKAEHQLVLSVLRQHVTRVIRDRNNTTIPPKARALLLNFAATYGTPRMGARKAPDGEAMTMRYSVRMTPSHSAIIERAAAKAKMTPVDFIRQASVLAARVDLGQDEAA